MRWSTPRHSLSSAVPRVRAALYHGWRRHGARARRWLQTTAVAVMMGVIWAGGVAMGGVVGLRYGECRLREPDANRLREELGRQLSGLGTAQIGVLPGSAAAARLEGEAKVLRERLRVLDSMPAEPRPAVWRTLTACPAVWADSVRAPRPAEVGDPTLRGPS